MWEDNDPSLTLECGVERRRPAVEEQRAPGSIQDILEREVEDVFQSLEDSGQSE